MSSISKNTKQQERRRILEKISPPTLPLLTHLMGNSYLLFTRFFPPTKKKTKITTEVFSIDEDGDEAKTHLQRVLTLISKKKKKISPKLSAFTIKRRVIMPTDILRKGKCQKTNDGFKNLYTGNYS